MKNRDLLIALAVFATLAVVMVATLFEDSEAEPRTDVAGRTAVDDVVKVAIPPAPRTYEGTVGDTAESDVQGTVEPITTFALDAERTLLDRLNRSRADDGQPALVRDPVLDTRARVWLSDVVAAGAPIRSGYPVQLIDSGAWATSAENVIGGRSVVDVLDQIESSPADRTNVVNPAFTAIGLGAYEAEDGTLWTVQLFGG